MEGAGYAAAIAPPLPPPEIAQGDIAADVCVVGGGLTGLSAAIGLARAGASVVLLEAGRVGDGATGRSGGQMIPGMRHGGVELVKRFGVERSRALIEMTLAARTRMLAIGDRHGCPVIATGHLTAAARAGDMPGLVAEERCMADVLGYRDHQIVDRGAIQGLVQSDVYHGGLLDRLGGHVDPLAYARALAAEARAAGVRIAEASPVQAIDTGSMAVRTPSARIAARDIVLACDAFVGTIAIDGRPAPMRSRLMPVNSFSVATAPLSEARAEALLPTDAAVADTRFALDYFRLSRDRRLLFSGGERYTLAPPGDIDALVRGRLEHVFPQLAGIAIDHAWAGTVAVTTTRFPHVGRQGRLWFAHGYSGHGLLLAQAAGAAIAAAIGGDSGDHDLLAGLPTHDWPGGGLLRHPLYTAGMLWFALKDRL